MRKLFLTASAMALTLSACSQEVSDKDANEVVNIAEEEAGDSMAQAEQSMAPAEPLAELAAPPVVAIPVVTPETAIEQEATDDPQGQASMPDFTYTHAYRFEGADSELDSMQDAHVAACDDMGPQQCRLANYSQDRDGISGVEASLELYVASDKIRDLATQMTNIARDFGGERVEANITSTNTTQRLDQAQLQVRNNLTEKDRLQAIIDSRRSTRTQKQVAAEQLAALTPQLNANQRQLDNVASDLGFTKMEVRYSSSSLFGPYLPYALIILLIAAIGGLLYRSKQRQFAEPVAA